ncbi:predicted protein [Histoplasma capsulatum G186AR]|uniref:Uncharacterized protein n=1 Tax=Ajellomyces capsulatus (strain G186AR / H82 / ATCC MYA-2454 / RMSCC 2432) TaxID=447093 RepID=C0NY39_AJECG|nr:uncharacterized protein HCBG_07833 [Histoplasma capsulatum G186AR]EEH03707.1 predicted protein [Histoplasma capsulatum G186AR]
MGSMMECPSSVLFPVAYRLLVIGPTWNVDGVDLGPGLFGPWCEIKSECVFASALLARTREPRVEPGNTMFCQWQWRSVEPYPPIPFPFNVTGTAMIKASSARLQLSYASVRAGGPFCEVSMSRQLKAAKSAITSSSTRQFSEGRRDEVNVRGLLREHGFPAVAMRRRNITGDGQRANKLQEQEGLLKVYHSLRNLHKEEELTNVAD